MRSWQKIIGLSLSLFMGMPTYANQQPIDDAFRAELKELIDSEHSFGDKFEAEVWLTDMSTRLAKRAPAIPEKERFEVLVKAHQYSTSYGLDPQLVLAVIEVESNFDRFAISNAGAIGLMQIMPFWRDEIGHPSDNLLDIETNLRYGCAILSIYLKREKKDMTSALARYNGSYGQMKYPMKVYRSLRQRWRE